MKKILIINTVRFGMGGMSSVIVNYLKNMNKTNMEITIIANTIIEKSYEETLKKSGINIIILRRNYRVIRYVYQLYKIMKKEKFDVVHVHGNSSTMAFETVPAYLNKIEKRIIHSHNVSCKHKILNKILWPILNKTHNLALACSNEAGKWLFKNEKKYQILNNAINLDKYKYSEEVRNQIRRDLELDNSYVIGHVGYFNEQKNHEKLFQIVNCLKNKIDLKLLCISGNSEVPNNIKEMIKKYDLENHVEILLERKDVNKLLQVMDCFVFPSKFEGLGLALIEAQATGLECLASNVVPKKARVCEELVSYIDLIEDSKEWSKLILDIKDKNFKSRNEKSINAINQLKKASYDITIEAEKLRQIYMK